MARPTTAITGPATALSCWRLALSRLVYGMMLCEPPNLAER